MNKYVQKVVSLFLILLITLLVLDYFNIIYFAQIVKDSISFATLALIIFSSTAAICSNDSGFSKFLNYLILLCIFVGLLIFIITGKLNVIIFAGLGFTIMSSLLDMIYHLNS